MNLVGSLAAEQASSANYLPLLLIAGLFALTYFMIIRPQSKRRRAMVELQSSLAPGVEVVTIGGLHGTVVAVADDTVDLRIAPGVSVTFARGAIARVVPQPGTATTTGSAGIGADSPDIGEEFPSTGGSAQEKPAKQ